MIIFWTLWILGIKGSMQQRVETTDLDSFYGKYNSSGYMLHLLESFNSDSTLDQSSLLDESSAVHPHLRRFRRQAQAEAPGPAAEQTTPQNPDADQPDKKVLEFKWLSYLLIFAIICLVTLLLIGMAFLTYFITSKKCKGKQDGGCGGSGGGTETEIECSCEDCCKTTESSDGGDCC